MVYREIGEVWMMTRSKTIIVTFYWEVKDKFFYKTRTACTPSRIKSYMKQNMLRSNRDIIWSFYVLHVQ